MLKQDQYYRDTALEGRGVAVNEVHERAIRNKRARWREVIEEAVTQKTETQNNSHGREQR